MMNCDAVAWPWTKREMTVLFFVKRDLDPPPPPPPFSIFTDEIKRRLLRSSLNCDPREIYSFHRPSADRSRRVRARKKPPKIGAHQRGADSSRPTNCMPPEV